MFSFKNILGGFYVIRFSHNDFVDVDGYYNKLSSKKFIYIDYDKMSCLNNQMNAKAKTLSILAIGRMAQISSAERMILTSDAIFDYLVKYEQCPEHYFFPKKRQSFSLDMNLVLSKLYQKGYATEFLDYYMASRSYKAKVSKLDKILQFCMKTNIYTKDGNALAKVPFEVNRQPNLRFNYKNFDIISQICKEVCNSVAVENGYCLVWGDFAQSDFRSEYNMFLRSPENDIIMNSCEDKYEALARMVAKARNEEFHLEDFKRDRPLYKKLTLATTYGKRSSQIPEEDSFIKMMTAFINKCPKYVEFYERLERRAKLGLPIPVTSYFGDEELCPNYAHDIESTRNRSLNCPVQKATSELVILTVNKLLDMFYKNGCTEDDICLYYTRHDEPIFKVKISILDKLAWIFKQFETILVDNWTPLKLEFEAGYYYKEVDEDLMFCIKDSYTQHNDKIEIFESGEYKVNDYLPIKDVLELHTHFIRVGNQIVLALYAPTRNEVLFSLLDEVADESIIAFIIQRLEQCEDKIVAEGYDDVLIYNNNFSGDAYGSETYFKFIKDNSILMHQVTILCQYLTCCYCKKNGVESSINPPSQSESEFIDSVGNLSILEV